MKPKHREAHFHPKKKKKKILEPPDKQKKSEVMLLRGNHAFEVKCQKYEFKNVIFVK